MVKVTGTVSEFNTVTQITATAADSVELVQDGVGAATAASLPANVLGTAREAFEGMLVKPSATCPVPPRLQPQPAELRRAVDQPAARAAYSRAPQPDHAGRGVRDPAARHAAATCLTAPTTTPA